MKALSDQKLITLVQITADGEAFNELARRHRPALIAFLKSLGGPSDLAEDAAQESFILAYRKIGQFRFSSNFRTWLFRIAYRERARLGKKDTQLDKKRQAFQADLNTPTPPDSDVLLDVGKGLAELSELERTAIILCDAYELSHGDAADMMNAPLGSVKTYVRRARRKMREFFDHEQEGQADG